MNLISLLNWTLISTVLLGAWWLCYRSALRSERGFAYNRVFLVLGPLLAAGLPLLPVAWPAGWGAGPAVLPGMAAVLLPTVRVGAAAGTDAGTVASWTIWLWSIYLGGAILMLARLGLGLARLWWATRALPRERHAGYTLVRTHGRLPTSSFGRHVFWDETLALSASEARQVLAHELAHVGQGHTYDRLLLELLRAGLWFNPFVHLCGRALALTHEYLADEAVLHQEAATAPAFSSAHSYAHLLARQVATRLGFFVPLAHSFSHSQTLSRIAMIQKTNPVCRWKQWLALPLLGVLFIAVACEKATAQTNVQQTPPPPSVPVPADNKPASVNKLYVYVEQMPMLPNGGGNAAIVESIQRSIVYPVGVSASGRVFVSFTVNQAGGVQDIKVVKSLVPAFDKAVVAAVEKLPNFIPGKQSGKPVNVSFTVPIMFAQEPARK